MLGEYKNLADTFTTYAQSSVQDDWPTIALPFFALHTQNFHDQSGLEEVSFYPAVRKDQVESWLGFSGTHHEEIVQDGHMTEHGSLDNLNPVGYKSFISRSQEGTLVPENDNKPFYYPSWHAFPAPTTYNLINWNLASVDAYGKSEVSKVAHEHSQRYINTLTNVLLLVYR